MLSLAQQRIMQWNSVPDSDPVENLVVKELQAMRLAHRHRARSAAIREKGFLVTFESPFQALSKAF